MARAPQKGFGGNTPAFINNPGKKSRNQYTGRNVGREEEERYEDEDDRRRPSKPARNPTRVAKERGFEKDKPPKFFKNQKRETLLQRLDRQITARGLERYSQESFKWYTNKLRTLGIETAQKEMLSMKDYVRQSPRPGFMYTYAYWAKHAQTLPYFDKFPLIIMVGPAPGGWYGINLHYLSPRYRAAFFDKLLAIMNNTNFNDRTKLQITYGLLKSTPNYKEFKPCFKHYLKRQLRSNLIRIPANEWEAALYVPSAQFTAKGAKYANSRVWNDSIQKIIGK